MKLPTLEYGDLLEHRLGPGRGLDPARLRGDLQERFASALLGFRERRDRGELGFLDLPTDASLARQVVEVADSFAQWFEELVVVGIGGSSLGTRALAEGLLGGHWNELDDEARDHFPRLHFLDNPDPDTTAALLDRLDLRRTLFNVVSKSGGTVETIAQLQIIEERLRAAVGEEAVRGHLLFTTDPERGDLRRLADAMQVPALPVPSNVGGRFSVLSPVGLLAAATVGIEVDRLLAGAAAMADRCLRDELVENPAGILATLLHASDRDMGRSVHVFMPYSDRLRATALWFQQLWAESLGKRPGTGGSLEASSAGVGPTPVAALGAVDQHSLLQLLMDGPDDKVVLFARIRRRRDDLAIPGLHLEAPSFGRVAGHTLGGLLDIELRATREALRRVGRPSLTLELDTLDEESLGATLMLCQIATVLAGELYGVNPLDQPGVELSKTLTAEFLASGSETREGGHPSAVDRAPWTV